MTVPRTKPIDREIFDALCKVRILLRAAKKPVARERLLDGCLGQNPTAYDRTLPLLLNRLVRIGWLERATSLATTRTTQPYRLTREGRMALTEAATDC